MYQRREQQAGPMLAVEQARKRNAELHIELKHLEAAGTSLQQRIDSSRRTLDDQLAEAKAELSAARDRLTRVIKATDASRAQAENIKAAAAYVSKLPEPKYGGRSGLEAATRELAEHEAKKKLAPMRPAEPRIAAGDRHGTSSSYIKGCRCDACVTRKATWPSRANRKKKQAA